MPSRCSACRFNRCRWIVAVLLPATLFASPAMAAEPWARHTIDGSSRGADGVRLRDVNGDGLPDATTGWEEGGLVRVYLHPGAKRVREPWPAVTVGKVRSPEDAVLVDLDGDGAVDVVSSCEGGNRTMYVHWAPRDPQRYLEPDAWQTEPMGATAGKQAWMFCLPLAIDGRHGIDLIAGSKAKGASVGWLEAPEDARRLDRWRWHALYDAGWIMSLEAADVDGDGDRDVVASDRKGKSRGVLWLENPGANKAGEDWTVHRVGGDDREVMFLDVADLDQDGNTDILAMTIGHGVTWFRRKPGEQVRFEPHTIEHPPGTGRGKSVRAADVDLDGQNDLVISCETSTPPKAGLVWMSCREAPSERQWKTHPLSGPEGVKFDLVQLFDLDADGDLDVLTCEERANLGVIWYENPAKNP